VGIPDGELVMQTFVPLGSDFAGNAKVLDMKRLGKQRVEGLQILRTLTGVGKGWENHPIVKMWKGHEYVLGLYTIAMCDEWISKGYKDTCRDQIISIMESFDMPKVTPMWLEDPELKLSHKSNLIRKMPDHYGKLWAGVPNDLPYKWVA
jgi:hypothetical protein